MSYTPGWITVPGKGRRWRTAEGNYMMQRPAGSAPGVFGALQSAWSKADKNLGGWLPGGGTANPASKAVKTVSKAAVSGGVLSLLPRPAVMDAAGALGLPVIAATAAALQPRLKKVVGTGALPKAQEMNKQLEVVKSGHNYLQRHGSGILGIDQLTGVPSNVSARKMISFEDEAGPGGPHFEPSDSRKEKPGATIKGMGTIRVNRDTPAWVWAHEMGHAVDHLKRPNSFLTEDKFRKMPFEQKTRFMDDARLRMGGGAAGFISSRPRPNGDNRSVLEAGVEGALLGVASNWDMLSKEVVADVHGRKIAKDAGISWDNKANAAAKGSYALHTAGPGFMQGAAGEILSRMTNQTAKVIGDAFIDPAVRSMRGGDSKLEEGLRKYGYDPREYVMDKDFSVRGRHPAGKAVIDEARKRGVIQ